MERVEVAVVGAGQAGLALSHELTAAGVDHVVLERGHIGETWRRRWDSFCLVTPNWSVQLPGLPYDGDDPDGFMPRDEIVAYLQRYAASFGAPVREGIVVEAVHSLPAGGFELQTSAGPLGTAALVLATGAYQRPHRIPGAETLPPDLLQVDVEGYHNPGALPPGKVLVIGSGQTGVQLAEELHEAGREVYLSCGRAPWVPRRISGRDVVWWMAESGFMAQPVQALPTPAARLISNPLTSGHGGGHDLHLRTIRRLGVTLVGRFLGAEGREARFAPDLGEAVAWGDARYRELMQVFGKCATDLGEAFPVEEPEPFDPVSPERVGLSGFGAVIFTGGFRPDYRSWLPWPDAFDELGFPLHQDGESTVVPGLYFVGVHWLRTRQSALLFGVGDDARVVARRIVERAA
jgi:putative flavoprotein involved in K+ transport